MNIQNFLVGKMPLFVDFDKNQAQILVERACKVLRGLLAEALPAETPLAVRRRDGLVYSEWVPLARVSSPAPAEVTIQWNSTHAALGSLSVDARKKIHDELAVRVGDPIKRVQWI